MTLSPNPKTEKCCLDGPRFEVRVCKRCGYRRNRAPVMPRYERCGEPVSKPPTIAAAKP
jgi:hypothetical protein